MAEADDPNLNVINYNTNRQWKVLSYGKRYHACFLYRDVNKDRIWVKVTVDILESAGFICWYRDRDMVAGHTYAATIIKCIEQSIKIIVILSESFLESPRCKYDLDLALEECFSRGEDGETGALIPVAIDNCKIPKILKPLHVLSILEHEDDWLSI